MIVRILGEGQWEVPEHALDNLNVLDDLVERAVGAGDQSGLASALASLLDEVRSAGSALPDEELLDSDLILPAADSTLEDVRSMLSESDQGLIPG